MDSRATENLVNKGYANKEDLPQIALATLVAIWNADGMPNEGGFITHKTTLQTEISSHVEQLGVYLMMLKNALLMLGYLWLRKHNPVINWKKNTLWFTTCPESCQIAAMDTHANKLAEVA